MEEGVRNFGEGEQVNHERWIELYGDAWPRRVGDEGTTTLGEKGEHVRSF
jgi:hypothetical protein